MIGVVERGGKVRLRVIASRRGAPLRSAVRANVDPSAPVFTDDWPAYNFVDREFLGHSWINHSAGVYVDGDNHTNTIERFFGNLKTGMRGTYKYVSPRWLQSYLDEHAYHYNRRHDPRAMFTGPLDRAAK